MATEQPYDPGPAKEPPPMAGSPPGAGGMYTPPSQMSYAPPPHAASAGDATGGIIPYKNPKALLAYYIGIAGLFPVLGLPFSIAAVVLGIMGLRARKRNPAIKGTAHAWIGIVLGSISTLYNLLFVTALVAALIGAATGEF